MQRRVFQHCSDDPAGLHCISGHLIATIHHASLPRATTTLSHLVEGQGPVGTPGGGLGQGGLRQGGKATRQGRRPAVSTLLFCRVSAAGSEQGTLRLGVRHRYAQSLCRSPELHCSQSAGTQQCDVKALPSATATVYSRSASPKIRILKARRRLSGLRVAKAMRS